MQLCKAAADAFGMLRTAAAAAALVRRTVVGDTPISYFAVGAAMIPLQGKFGWKGGARKPFWGEHPE